MNFLSSNAWITTKSTIKDDRGWIKPWRPMYCTVLYISTSGISICKHVELDTVKLISSESIGILSIAIAEKMKYRWVANGWWSLYVIFLCMPIIWQECDTCIPEIRKRRLAINLVWCLWLHFLIIIPACPWVLIAFWILIFDVVRLLSIRPVHLFRILPNTPLKDEWACWIHARAYRLKLNYLKLFSLLNSVGLLKKCLWLD